MESSLVAAYHQRSAVRTLAFPVPLTHKTQQRILALTHASPLSARYPPSAAYSRAFLKALLTAAQHDDEAECEDLLLAYVDALSSASSNDELNFNPYAHVTSSAATYVSYPLCGVAGASIGIGEWITLREATAKISQGTTGLVTWEAALRFAEYLNGCGTAALYPRLDIRCKRVLELGSGPGLLGIVAARLGAAYVCLTDFDARVLSTLEENVAINFGHDDSDAFATAPAPTVAVKSLDWDTPDPAILADADILICSDCVYDPTLVPALVHTLRAFVYDGDSGGLAESPRRREAWVAVTKRQQSTQDKFLRAVADASMRITDVPLNDVPELFRHEYGLGDMGLMVLSRL
ncbi:putative methyltransferase-domain-containing protein [Geranomyces variabilis]|nr:putative methyltransferase-domain-containing protein [Geranomyces variabilis]